MYIELKCKCHALWSLLKHLEWKQSFLLNTQYTYFTLFYLLCQLKDVSPRISLFYSTCYFPFKFFLKEMPRVLVAHGVLSIWYVWLGKHGWSSVTEAIQSIHTVFGGKGKTWKKRKRKSLRDKRLRGWFWNLKGRQNWEKTCQKWMLLPQGACYNATQVRHVAGHALIYPYWFRWLTA